MFAALAHAEGDADYAKRHWMLLTKWADFLLEKGFDPENQLCTDDLAGHLAHNTNLSIKAIEALAAYAQLAEKLGDHPAASKYRERRAKHGRQLGEGLRDGWGSLPAGLRQARNVEPEI